MFCFRVLTSFCLLLLVNQAISSQEVHHRQLFKEFIETHNKEYDTPAEHEHRFNIFVQNLKKAKELQSRQKGTATYGVTKFSDLTAAEFKAQYCGLNPNANGQKLPPAKIPDVTIPKKFDWRKKNVVTEVKDQGYCGSCWAFSTTGNIESLYAIKNKKLVSLSEQELVDCDTLDDGCSGGLMTNAYEAIISLGGLETESNYPYTGEDDTCTFKKSKIAVTISGGVNISNDESKMAKWLFKHAPISIGINADDMQLYTGGISHPTTSDCDPDYLDHGVLIVGYGVAKKNPYWIIKNSWGTSWGEKGYYRVFRGAGVCGLNTMTSSAVL